MSRVGRLRILVVDNCPDTADVLAMMVRLWGYDAEACYDGKTALERALVYLPQVVLLDIGLPKINGFEVALDLRDQPQMAMVVIIGITGHGSAAHRGRARAAGFDHYLLKPVAPDHLQGLLGQVTLKPVQFALLRGGDPDIESVGKDVCSRFALISSPGSIAFGKQDSHV